MQEDLYITLIHKKLSGDINQTEASRLEAWLEAAPENRTVAESIEKAWKAGGEFKPDVEVSLDADFAILEKRMEQDDSEAEIVRLKPPRNWPGVAAAVAVLIIAAFLINNFLTPKAEWLVMENTSGRPQSITLNDGSRVSLGENSMLRYPRSFAGSARETELSGEAFFEVEKNPEIPFIVKTQNTVVEVLGTSFSVRDRGQDAEAEVLVNTGKVKMSVKGLDRSLILETSEKGVWKKQSHELIELKAVSLNELARYTGHLSFVSTPLSDVIKDLEACYKIRIVNKNTDLQDCPFTNTFNNKSLEIVLETIKTVYGLEIETINTTTYRLSGGSCR